MAGAACSHHKSYDTLNSWMLEPSTKETKVVLREASLIFNIFMDILARQVVQEYEAARQGPASRPPYPRYADWSS